MEQHLKPVFSKREVVVELPDSTDAFEQTKEVVAKVVYVGKNTLNYKEGDTILFDKTVGRELKYFGGNLWKIENEDYIICNLVDFENSL